MNSKAPQVWLDLHFHSLRSDGTQSPAQLAEMASARGLALCALSDHDSIAGFEEFEAHCHGVPTLCALELSCREYDRSVHLLLYGIAASQRESLAVELASIRKDRVERVYRVCEKLAALDAAVDPEEILSRTAHGTPGRPHIAAALVRAGHCSTLEQAFAKYIRDGGPADVPIRRLSLADGLALGRAHGAKMSLAHPHVYNAPALVEEMLYEYKEHGLEGLECYTYVYSNNQRKRWAQLADQHGCVATAGSDYHGANKVDVQSLGVALPQARARALGEWLGLDLF